LLPLPPRSTLFPYTTLFRSSVSTPSYEFISHPRMPVLSPMPPRTLYYTAFGNPNHETLSCRGLRRGIPRARPERPRGGKPALRIDRKSTRLNSSHDQISYAV